MTRPFKIVRVAAEDSDIAGRSVNKTDIFDLACLVKVVEISAVDGLNSDRRTFRSLRLFGGGYVGGVFLECIGELFARQVVRAGLDPRGHVLDTVSERDRIRLFAVHSLEFTC